MTAILTCFEGRSVDYTDASKNFAFQDSVDAASSTKKLPFVLAVNLTAAAKRDSLGAAVIQPPR